MTTNSGRGKSTPGAVRMTIDTKRHLERVLDFQAARLGVRPGQGLSFNRLIDRLASLGERHPDELTELLSTT